MSTTEQHPLPHQRVYCLPDTPTPTFKTTPIPRLIILNSSSLGLVVGSCAHTAMRLHMAALQYALPLTPIPNPKPKQMLAVILTTSFPWAYCSLCLPWMGRFPIGPGPFLAILPSGGMLPKLQHAPATIAGVPDEGSVKCHMTGRGHINQVEMKRS